MSWMDQIIMAKGGSGGGGGGGGAEPLIVTVTISQDASATYYTGNKTYSEIKSAMDAGRNVYFEYETEMHDVQLTISQLAVGTFSDSSTMFVIVALDVVEAVSNFYYTAQTADSNVVASFEIH